MNQIEAINGRLSVLTVAGGTTEDLSPPSTASAPGCCLVLEDMTVRKREGEREETNAPSGAHTPSMETPEFAEYTQTSHLSN